ncbi:MAG: PepSY-associated TM helix domain-containing protein [Planctomycetaceae bacterium]
MTTDRSPVPDTRPPQVIPPVTTTSFPPRQRPLKQRLQTLIRWLHIYASLAGLMTVLFFGLTGLTLNHPQWFDTGYQAVREDTGTIDRSLISGKSAEVKRLEIVEFLRSRYGIHAALKDFHVDEFQLNISFAGPAYSADISIDRETAEYEFNELRLGFTAIINDLHKGRDSGPAWSLFIDASAVLMIFISITGTLLLIWLKRLWRSGLWSIIGGTVFFAMLAWWVVP